MTDRSSSSKLAGRIGGLFALVGVALFMAGLFGAPKNLVFVGIALIVLSLAAYYVEEIGVRKREARARS